MSVDGGGRLFRTKEVEANSRGRQDEVQCRQFLSAWRKMTRRQQKRNQAWLCLSRAGKMAEWGKAAQGLRQNHLPRQPSQMPRLTTARSATDRNDETGSNGNERKTKMKEKKNDLAGNDQYARAQSAGLTYGALAADCSVEYTRVTLWIGSVLLLKIHQDMKIMD